MYGYRKMKSGPRIAMKYRRRASCRPSRRPDPNEEYLESLVGGAGAYERVSCSRSLVIDRQLSLLSKNAVTGAQTANLLGAPHESPCVEFRPDLGLRHSRSGPNRSGAREHDQLCRLSKD